MKHLSCLLPCFFLSVLFIGCTGCGQRGASSSETDSLSLPSAVAPFARASVDTLRGFVGDGTSMHLIELVNDEATDTLLLEIEDDADHRATLTVGHEIRVVVRRTADGQQTVLATFDVE